MRLLLACALLLTAASASAECVRVWVPGCWTGVGTTRVWTPGRYEERVVTTTTTTTTYTVPPPPPTQVWVPERWEWNGSAWELRPGYWAASAPPAPVVVQPTTTTTQVVEVRQVEPPRPRVSVSVGLGVGSCGPVYGHHHYRDHGHYGHRHHDGGSRVVVRPPAPLPGSHALPRPPKWVPDPLGVFRHDPLRILRK